MHPRAIEIFNAIQNHDNATLMTLVKEIPEAPWIVNEQGKSALQFALDLSKSEAANDHRAVDKTTVFVFLTQLVEQTLAAKLNNKNGFDEAKFNLDYALLISVKFYLRLLNSETIEKLFSSVSSEFTFLKPEEQTNYSYYSTKFLNKLSAAPSEAELRLTKSNDLKKNLTKELQNYIRALSVGGTFRAILDSSNEADFNEVLKGLKTAIEKWKVKDIFALHTEETMKYTGLPTSTVQSLNKIQAALAFYLDNKGQLPSTLSSEQAKGLMFLCAKCYPFSSSGFRITWSNLANSVFESMSKNPEVLVELFKITVDKQWLRTDDGVPYHDYILQHGLLSTIRESYITAFLKHKEANHLCAYFENKTDLNMPIPDTEMSLEQEVLALYTLNTGRKFFTPSSISNKHTLYNTHFLMVNNPKLSVYFSSINLQDNPLKSLTHLSYKAISHNKTNESNETSAEKLSSELIFELTQVEQLQHLSSMISILSYTSNNFTVGITKDLLEKLQPSLIKTLQLALGPNQAIHLQIYKDLSHQELSSIRADLVITQYAIGPGPILSGKTNTKAVGRSDFHIFYQKLDWSDHLDQTKVEDQFKVISESILKNRPLFFIFDHKYFDLNLLQQVQAFLLKHKKVEPCLIRFDLTTKARSANETNPIVTSCDYQVYADRCEDGPLKQAGLCARIYNATTSQKQTQSQSPNPASSSSSSSSGSSAIILRPSVSTAIPLSPQGINQKSLSNEILVGEATVPHDMKDGDDYSGSSFKI